MMQCNQSFCGSRFSNYGQYYPFNSTLHCTRPYPEIIGEGDVISVVLPDGNLQFFFTPTANWCTPVAGPPLANNNISWNPNTGIWYIRTISNPLQPGAFNQPQNQTNCGDPLLGPYECNIPPLGYNLKFHNDHWTSTTDLQYFYPCLNRDWPLRMMAKGSAAVQVELLPVPNTICHQDVFNKPCKCITNPQVNQIKCKCNELVDTSSKMSVEDTKSKVRFNSRERNHKTKPSCTDKCVTTYTDQASGCTTEKGRETQTYENSNLACSTDSLQSYKGKLEMRTPKTTYNKKKVKKPKLSQESSMYTSESCCDSCCCWSDEHGV